MNRREFLGLAAIPFAQALDGQPIQRSRGAVIGIDGGRLDGVPARIHRCLMKPH